VPSCARYQRVVIPRVRPAPRIAHSVRLEVALEHRRCDPKLSRQPVKLPDYQSIAGVPAVEGCLLLAPVALDARGLLDKHLGTPGNVQGVQLEGEALALGRDPDIAAVYLHAAESSPKHNPFRREVSRGVTRPERIPVTV
jgi:hypothetical protein